MIATTKNIQVHFYYIIYDQLQCMGVSYFPLTNLGPTERLRPTTQLDILHTSYLKELAFCLEDTLRPVPASFNKIPEND